MNRASLLAVLAVLGASLAAGGEAPARLPQGLVGTWLHRTQETEIRVELRADGRYARVVREDEDTERDAGRFRVRGNLLELHPDDGDEEDMEKFTFRLAGDTLDVTDEDGETYRLVRQGVAPPPQPGPVPGPGPEAPSPRPAPSPPTGGVGMGMGAMPFPGAGAPGPRIVNVALDFIAYHAACAQVGEAERAAKWDTLLEERHPAFFNDALYRGKQDAERQRFKAWCLATFWRDVVPRMGAIRALSASVPAQIPQDIRAFQKVFPDFRPATDFYVTVSFTFRGKVVQVGGKDAFGIGLDFLDPARPQELAITIAHELSHLYHFQSFDPRGGLYRTLWAEGLAAYASAVVVPGHKMSAYLGFSGEKMNRCEALLGQMALELRKNMGENDARLRRIYFGAEPNDTQIPSEAGYYVGYLIIEALAKDRPLAELALLDPKAVYPLVEAQLTRLAGAN